MDPPTWFCCRLPPKPPNVNGPPPPPPCQALLCPLPVVASHCLITLAQFHSGAVLYYVMLCYGVLCCAALCYAAVEYSSTMVGGAAHRESLFNLCLNAAWPMQCCAVSVLPANTAAFCTMIHCFIVTSCPSKVCPHQFPGITCNAVRQHTESLQLLL